MANKREVGEINFTKEKLGAFKMEYEEHKGRGRNAVFKFEGKDLKVGYAKYMIEFLETKFKNE